MFTFFHDIVTKAAQYRAYRQLFPNHAAIQAFRRARLDLKEIVTLPVTTLNGHAVQVRGGTTDHVALWEVLTKGGHLPARPLPDPVRTIVDLGANVGYASLHLATLYPDAKILAVEMDAGNALACRENLRVLGDRAQVVCAAAWTSNGEVKYGGPRVIESSVCGTRARQRPEVRCAPARSIDTLLHDAGFETVDYLKMDIEGAEVELLRTPLTWAPRVQSLGIEWHPPADPITIRRVLQAAGYQVMKHPQHACGLFGWRDPA